MNLIETTRRDIKLHLMVIYIDIVNTKYITKENILRWRCLKFNSLKCRYILKMCLNIDIYFYGDIFTGILFLAIININKYKL